MKLFIAAVLCAGALLLLPRLDNGRLWQDEAETAVLGKNTLAFGYPRATDGINRVNPMLSVRKNDAWTYHSWLPMYLTAGSFALFGADTWQSRLPFALIGLLSIWLYYILCKRMIRDPMAVRIAVISLLLCVPFLLHMRQCRYYAPAVLGTLWTVLAYWRFIQSKKLSELELVTALTFLFHSDHGAFAPVFGALALDYLTGTPPEKRLKGTIMLGWVLLLTVPWIIYLDAGQHHKAFSWKEISHHSQFYVRQINKFIVPFFFWAIVCGIWRRPFKNIFEQRAREWRILFWTLWTGFLFLVFVPEQRHFRYLIFLLPFFLLMQAALLAAVLRVNKRLGAALLALVLLTSVAHYGKFRSLPLEFAGELGHDYRGPVDGIVEKLLHEAAPGQTLKAPYEEHPILFYNPKLVVEKIVTQADFEKETYPDWIVLRRDWLRREFLESPYYEQIRARYTELVLDAPDIPWQNRPDPGYHKFRTDDKAPPVVIFRKER